MQKYNLLLILIIGVGTLLCSCQKTVLSPIAYQKILLAGSGSGQDLKKVWQLDSVIFNKDSVVPLTKSQKLFEKTFYYGGGYKDSDGNVGKWEINELNVLKQYIVTNYYTDSVMYQILYLNANKLKIRSNGIKNSLDYYFTIYY